MTEEQPHFALKAKTSTKYEKKHLNVDLYERNPRMKNKTVEHTYSTIYIRN